MNNLQLSIVNKIMDIYNGQKVSFTKEEKTQFSSEVAEIIQRQRAIF